MQLHRIVHFHKTIGDQTRIQIIILLKTGPLNGQELASKLNLTPPTISYHIRKLKEIDLIYQRRDKNTIYFYLNKNKLERMASAILTFGAANENKIVVGEKEKQSIINQFTDDSGRLTSLPKRTKNKLILLEYIAQGLDKERGYNEKELNEYVNVYFDDVATIRREFVMFHFMNKNEDTYEMNPEEMWLIQSK